MRCEGCRERPSQVEATSAAVAESSESRREARGGGEQYSELGGALAGDFRVGLVAAEGVGWYITT